MVTRDTQVTADQLVEHAETMWNEGDLDAAEEFFADDVLVHNVPEQMEYDGIGEFKQWAESVRTGFPDFEVTTSSVIADDERVVSQWQASGTHDGRLPNLDIPPTNREVSWEGVTVYELTDEQVTEAWWYYDMFSMLTQLGVVPESPTG